MLNGNIFDIAMESQKPQETAPAAVVAIEVEDAVATLEDTAAIHKMDVEIEQMTTVTLESIATADKIAGDIAIEERILADDKGTATVSALVLTNLESTVANFGMSLESMGIAVEEAVQTPSSAIKISIEEKKKLITKIIESVKAVIRKIGAFFKKLIAKVAVMVSRGEKNAEALKKKIEDTKEWSVTKFDEKAEMAVKKKFLVIGNEIDGITDGTVSKLIEFQEALIANSKLAFEALVEANGIVAKVGKDETQGKFLEEMLKVTEKLSGKSSAAGYVGQEAMKDVDGKNFSLATRISGSAAYTFVVNTEAVKLVKEADKLSKAGFAEKAGMKSVIHYGARKVVLDAKKAKECTVLSKDSALTVVEKALELAKASKGFADTKGKELDEVNKALKAFEANEEAPEIAASLGSNLLTFNSKMLLDSVFNYLGTINELNWLATQSLTAQKSKKSDKKDDKKDDKKEEEK